MTTPPTVRGADVFAQALRAAGVERVFAMSGNQLMIAFDAFLDADIRPVHIRHEAAAVHMADGWAQLTGKVGIAVVPAGPGFANALSALYTARMSESPVVLIGGHAPVSKRGLGGFQDMPQAELASHFTKASWTVDNPARIMDSIGRAIQIATSGRRGPVHVSLPEDILAATLPSLPAFPANFVHPNPWPLEERTAREVLTVLGEAARPLIVTGPVMNRGDGKRLARTLEETTGIPVVCMESPRGVNDPCLGAFAEALAEADAVLTLGKMVDFSLQSGAALNEHCKVIDIDAESAMIERSRKIFGSRVVIAAEAGAASASQRLIDAAGGPVNKDAGWASDVRDAVAYRPAAWQDIKSKADGPIHPVDVAREVQKRLDAHPDSVLIVDGGEFGQWQQACLSAPNRLINGLAGAIGTGIPYAVAAGLAKPGVPVISLMGDGSAGFHLSEFDTAARSGSKFTLIIGNDARWNAEYQIQLRNYGAQRLHSCELNATRYDQVAANLGCHGEHVARPDELGPALDRAAAIGTAACLNVAIESHPAPVVRRKTTANAAASH
jgi:thiamine pyrophosphate-dependent acetolactate synthase large subunit-like protein